MADDTFLPLVAERQKDMLPGLLGLSFEKVGEGHLRGRFTAAKHHLAPNGYLHAASVIALADTACGYATMVFRPDGAERFTTIELKSNFLGTARVGDEVITDAMLLHGGRTTQVWDAVVSVAGKTIALFRCTQMLIYPR
ncbi:MAG: hotdog fold thioesterase [Alphaproteobacteria bacterium]|nr:hotdog fold thioesterase [Alphaproteobacteria bacterium]